MVIRVNDRHEIESAGGVTVSELLAQMRYTFPHIIVKVDDVVVPVGEYATHVIPDGAEVFVIHLMAGG